jgi:S-methyl-5-thioribose-1-phosphate isomerase
METADHIQNMTVRGAPAIGATGAYAMVQAVINDGMSETDHAETVLKDTRPTAKDLFTAIEAVKKALTDSSPDSYADAALKAAEMFADESVQQCRKIGKHGSSLLKDGMNMLTHCNAGWLACVDWGTALAPVYYAKEEGKKIFVFVDETRPRCQGGRLTAWELHNENISHAVIADNAAAFYMAEGSIDIIITGADRIASNGDAANKIGTLEKAICARQFNIPFYIAAPYTTFDPESLTGKDIPIEERSGEEITSVSGMTSDSTRTTIRITNPGSSVKNPAFDVTPAELITGYITPDGIIKASQIEKIL